MSEKTCETCKHSEYEALLWCNHLSAMVPYKHHAGVAGTCPTPCSDYRKDGKPCGVEGKLWEAKENE